VFEDKRIGKQQGGKRTRSRGEKGKVSQIKKRRKMVFSPTKERRRRKPLSFGAGKLAKEKRDLFRGGEEC